jgi:hypothetical protein
MLLSLRDLKPKFVPSAAHITSTAKYCILERDTVKPGKNLQTYRDYALRWNVAGSRPDEENVFFLLYLILPASLGPGVYSASNRN